MARKSKKTLQVDSAAEASLRLHIQALGLSDADEYQAWCRQHCFSTGLQKTLQHRYRERLAASRITATAKLAESRKKVNVAQAIADVFEGNLHPDAPSRSVLWDVRRVSEAAGHDRHVKAKLLDLLLHVQPRTEFLETGNALQHYGNQPGNTWIDGLLALAHHWRLWRRSVEDWAPRTHNTRRQFASLARHLLAEYPVPAFMDAVWFMGMSPAAIERQEWFAHVGQGQNIRTARTPIALTKRMAHHFMLAPADSTVDQAVRWGQVVGLGGSPRLAKAIMTSRLGEHFEHDDFWITVIRFFIENPMLDLAHVGPVVDYLHDQRFVEREEFVAAGVIERRPPSQPNLTMKGRSPASLLRQVEQWHRQLGRESAATKGEWTTCGIRGFDFIEGQEGTPSLRRWTIREILRGRELVAEGRTMQHCVASYISSCARHVTSIWTLQMHNHQGTQRVLTIEVRLPTKVICQARGKRNILPDAKGKDILRRWAAQVGLTLAGYV